MREQLVTSIARTRADLLAWLNGIEGDAWSASTVCAPWTVKDVLSHAVEGEINVGRIYRSEVTEQGFVDPEEGVERWRALPGVAVRAALWQHGIATQRVLEDMTDEAWERPINAFGCRRVSQLVRLHLFDLAVHGHDLTDALQAPALWNDQLPFLAEYVVRAAPVTFRRRGLGATGTLAVSVPSLSAEWVLEGDSEGWTVHPGANAPTTVTLEPEVLVLLTTGRLQGSPSYDVTGDRSFAEQVLSAWRVV